MNTYTLRVIGASVACAALMALPALSSAAELRGGTQAGVGSTEVVNNDLYIAGSTITSAGTITGDLIAGGGTVLVTGPVSQDVMVGGGTLTILGAVGGSVRATGGTITIGGSVHDDVVVGGGSIQLSGGKIGRDVVVAGGAVRIDSPVAGNVRFVGGELYINGPVAGNVTADAAKVTLGSSAVISGNFTYKAQQEVVKEEGAQVLGTVSYTPKPAEDMSKKGLVALFTLWFFAKLLMMLAGAFVFGNLLRRFTTSVVESAFARSLAELGRGIVFLIVTPIVSVILLITVVGVPLGVLGLIGYAGVMIVGCLVAPILLGSALHKWISKGTAYTVSWKTILLGVVAYTILGFIPVLGWIIDCGFMVLTLGAIVKIKMQEVQNWR